MAYFKCSGGTNPTGNATEGDVLATKTFSNADGTDKVGTMPNRGAVSISLNASTTSYTIPAGYHNGSGTVSITTQTKSAAPSTSAQTISPDSGKLLSSVSISAISPQRSNGVSATLTGQDSTSPYVYFPYGWYPQNHATYGSYCRMTAAQAVSACPSQTKTATPTTRSASAVTVTPDSGKLLSSVTVNTNSVPNTNSGTYTYASGSTGGTVDLGAANTYRYVNAANVYAKGKADGIASGGNIDTYTIGGKGSQGFYNTNTIAKIGNFSTSDSNIIAENPYGTSIILSGAGPEVSGLYRTVVTAPIDFSKYTHLRIVMNPISSSYYRGLYISIIESTIKSQVTGYNPSNPSSNVPYYELYQGNETFDISSISITGRLCFQFKNYNLTYKSGNRIDGIDLIRTKPSTNTPIGTA